ncbi:hypothetical protein [Aquimarina algiphila]|uniref:Uncharacterized protein n=1 Tax=Aquimarina algiphila TaxID=2047982 RepID=A0A554VH00_9FLAO|nr:hypothetical protein [Aquimarina algiphila]TSE06738.1 hypothetical protein FOF46_18150 [Aquimarina algiphila]
MRKIISLFVITLMLSCSVEENSTIEEKNSSLKSSCPGELNGVVGLCGFDRHGDPIEYNVWLTNVGQISGFPTWEISTSEIEIVSTSRYSCKVKLRRPEGQVQHYNTIGTVDVSYNGNCVKSKPINITNCRDYSYTD